MKGYMKNEPKDFHIQTAVKGIPPRKYPNSVIYKYSEVWNKADNLLPGEYLPVAFKTKKDLYHFYYGAVHTAARHGFKIRVRMNTAFIRKINKCDSNI